MIRLINVESYAGTRTGAECPVCGKVYYGIYFDNEFSSQNLWKEIIKNYSQACSCHGASEQEKACDW